MAPVPKNTIEHFIHPGHQLVKLSDGTNYICDGCKATGTGTKYRCNPCDFDLHEYCATCPRTQFSFMHPHPLTLVVRKVQATPLKDRTCDVCGEFVEAMFYQCKDCEFDVHPLCTQLPQHVRHAYHPFHQLTLQSSAAGSCCVCGGACNSWRYRCGMCAFDIHTECSKRTSFGQSPSASGNFFAPQTSPFGIPPTSSFGIQQQGYGLNFALGVPSSSNPYNLYNNHNPNMYNSVNPFEAQVLAQVQAQSKAHAQVLAHVQAATQAEAEFKSQVPAAQAEFEALAQALRGTSGEGGKK